jgi:putative ABC transport system permease protein
MIRLALSSLRQHRGAYLGTFLAALLAVTLLAGGGLLLFSVLTAEPPADRFAATAAVVSGQREISVEVTTGQNGAKTKTKVKTERLTGAGTLPGDLPARLRTVPGVTAAVADYAFPIVVAGPAGRVLRGADDAPVVGHGWSSAALTPYRLREGRAPRPGEAVLDADLAVRGELRVGIDLTVTTRTGVRTVRVSGIAAPAGRDGLPAQGALFLADDEVAAVSGLAGPTAVGVMARPGVNLAAIRDLTGDAPVLTADRVRADLPGALPDYIGPISIFGFVIGITAFAGVFVLTGTVTLSVRHRLRELALLRTIGATPRRLRTLLGVESVLLAFVAALPAIPLGVLFARVVAARFQHLGMVPAQFTVPINVPVLLLAVPAAMLVTFVAARIAGRQAVRIAPTQAIAEAAAAPTGGLVVRTIVALIATAGAVAVLAFVPLDGPFGMGMTFISSALLLCTIAALGPLLVRGLLGVIGRPFGLAGLLSRAQSRRVAAVAMPLALMFTVNATMLLNSTLLEQLAAREQTARTAAATWQVTAAGGMPLDTAQRLAALPGVTGAAATLPTRVIAVQGGKPEDHAAQGLLTAGAESALDLSLTGRLDGDSFAASGYLMRQYGWRIGETVPLWLADGHRVELRLAAGFARNRGFGELVVPAGLVAAHDPRGLVNAVALRGEVADTIHRDWPGLRVARTGAAAPAGDASEQQGAFELMVAISLGFTAVAVVNTFAIATVARRQEFADLRLAGATSGQVHRLAAREAVLTVAVGLLLGAVTTGTVVGTFSTAQDGVFRLVVASGTYLGLAGTVALLGLLAGTVPARLMVRNRSTIR